MIAKKLIFVTKFHIAGLRGSPQTTVSNSGTTSKRRYFVTVVLSSIKRPQMDVDLLITATKTADELLGKILGVVPSALLTTCLIT